MQSVRDTEINQRKKARKNLYPESLCKKPADAKLNRKANENHES